MQNLTWIGTVGWAVVIGIILMVGCKWSILAWRRIELRWALWRMHREVLKYASQIHTGLNDFIEEEREKEKEWGRKLVGLEFGGNINFRGVGYPRKNPEKIVLEIVTWKGIILWKGLMFEQGVPNGVIHAWLVEIGQYNLIGFDETTITVYRPNVSYNWDGTADKISGMGIRKEVKRPKGEIIKSGKGYKRDA